MFHKIVMSLAVLHFGMYMLVRAIKNGSNFEDLLDVM